MAQKSQPALSLDCISTPMKPVGAKTAPMATSGLSPSAISCKRQGLDEALGDGFAGVLVSDFYAAYHHYPGLKQRCWVHLLRDIHDLKTIYPKDRQWPGGRRQSITFTRRPRTSPIPRHGNGSGSNSNWSGLLAQCRPYAQPGSRPRQPVPAYREAHQGTVCLRGCPRRAIGQQRCRAQPALWWAAKSAAASDRGTDTKMTLPLFSAPGAPRA